MAETTETINQAIKQLHVCRGLLCVAATEYEFNEIIGLIGDVMASLEGLVENRKVE